MIKINLLPPNIFEARIVKKLALVFGVVAVAIVIACVVITMNINSRTTDMRTQADAVQKLSEQADQLQSQADAERAQIAPVEQKKKFIEDVMAYNREYPKLYEELARFTYQKIVYSQVTPQQGGSLTIQATAPSLADSGRYLLNLYRATHIFSSVTLSGVPGSAGGGQSGMGTMTMPGAPAMPGVTSMPRTSMPTMPGRLSMPGLMPGTTSMAGAEPSQSEWEPGMRGATYAGMAAVATGVARAEAQRKSVTFAVTCTLAKALAPPQVPGSQAAQTAGGLGGMPMGMPTPVGPAMPTPGSGPQAQQAPPSSAEPSEPSAESPIRRKMKGGAEGE